MCLIVRCWEVTWLTWPQTTCVKNTRWKMWVPGGLLLSKSFIFLKKIACHWQCCEVATFCNRAGFTYDVIGQLPDLHEKYNIRLEWSHVIKEVKEAHARFQLSIANGYGTIARKPSGGGMWGWGYSAPWKIRIHYDVHTCWNIIFFSLCLNVKHMSCQVWSLSCLQLQNHREKFSILP